MGAIDWQGLAIFTTALAGLVAAFGGAYAQVKKANGGTTDPPGGDDGPTSHRTGTPGSLSVEELQAFAEWRERQKRHRPGHDMRLFPIFGGRIAA